MIEIYFFSQLFAVIGWLLLIYSYYKDEINELLFVQIISSIFESLSYLLLGAISGFITCLFELLQGFGYYKTDKDKQIFYISIIIYAIIGYFTFDGWMSLLPIIASLIEAYSLTISRKTAVVGSIISSVMWVLYDLIILSYAGAFTDFIMIVSNMSIIILGKSRLIKTNNLHFYNDTPMTKFAFSQINKLDIQNYSDEYLWDDEYVTEIYNRNKKSYTLIKMNGKIVGYINYLVLDKLAFEKLEKRTKLIYKYKVDDIINYSKRNKNYVLIESICIKKDYANEVAVNKIYKNIRTYIRKKYKNKYKIDSMLAIAVTQFEINILETCHFKLIKEIENKEKIYKLSNEDLVKYYLNK